MELVQLQPADANDKSAAARESTLPYRLNLIDLLLSEPRSADFTAGQLQKPLERDEKPAAKKSEFTIAREHGLGVKPGKDNSLEFTLQLEGQTKVITRCDKSEAGLEAAEKEIIQQTREKSDDLTKRYGVTFSTDNEEVEKQVTGVGPKETLLRSDKMIYARSPKLKELLGIEAALTRSEPSHLDVDGKTAVKFYFLRDTYIAGDTSSTVANFVAKDKSGKAAVYFGPNQTDTRPITEKDADKSGVPDEYSIQSLLTHELAHNSVYRLKWDDSATLERKCKQMGWIPYETPEGETTWILQAKNNQFFKMSTTDTEKWVRCDQKGMFLTDNGQSAAGEDQAQRITVEQMRDRALLRPPTSYFDNAIEMFAESMMVFRVNEKRRQEFLKSSPDLYQFIKQQDQSEIDLAYGKARKVRLPSGYLGEDNTSNRDLIARFEANK